MTEKKGFEVNGFSNEVECMLCSKPKPCYAVVCQAGTMSGNICGKCLDAQCRVRYGAKKTPSLS